jgi:hypothetical protein
VKFLKMVFRRFVHFPVLFIEKYRHGENRVGNPNFEKSLSADDQKVPALIYTALSSKHHFIS